MARSPKYTVVIIDPLTQWHTSRLGRWVSKREAMRVADMWERNGMNNVCVLDERGTIHMQLGNNAAYRNMAGSRKRTKPLHHNSLVGRAARTTRLISGVPVSIPSYTLVDVISERNVGTKRNPEIRYAVAYAGTTYWIDEDALEA